MTHLPVAHLLLAGLLTLAGCTSGTGTSDAGSGMDADTADGGPDLCHSGTDCAAGMTCVSDFRSCAAPCYSTNPCDADSDCGSGQVCGLSDDPCCRTRGPGNCVPRCPDTTCGGDQVCNMATGVCEAACTGGAACATGLTCDPTQVDADSRGCAPAACTSDSDCGTRVCVNGTCKASLGQCGGAPDAG